MKWLSTIKHAEEGKLVIERMELDETGFRLRQLLRRLPRHAVPEVETAHRWPTGRPAPTRSTTTSQGCGILAGRVPLGAFEWCPSRFRGLRAAGRGASKSSSAASETAAASTA